MIVFRKRLLFWLVKEYVRRWRKRIFTFFILGIITFFCLRFLIEVFLPKIPIGFKETIGVVGAYTVDTLPDFVVNEMSTGLTSISADGTIKPALSDSWEIKNNGKTYIFHLKKNLAFNDGVPFTSGRINYNFSDVLTIKTNPEIIAFELKDTYAPFLVTVSKPIFKKDFIGLGEYNIKNIDLNGNFIKSLTLVSKRNKYQLKIFQFYPTEEALKLAFVLGEVSVAKNIVNTSFKTTTLSQFPNVLTTKRTNYNHLVAVFYNTQDVILSDKRLRQSLTYLLPDTFEMGERAHTPFRQNFWAYQKSINEPENDLEHARVLAQASNASNSAALNLTIKTMPKFKKAAEAVVTAWKKMDVSSKIEITDAIPSDFQIFIGDFNIPKDPDQYTLWHSGQDNNITKFKNLRIDSLLEEGRKTTDTTQRKKIYADFLKYLLDEAPASFLYFPYEYDLVRK